ncbi:hypothetical protein PLEOSDRAFT_154830 [Pleurotus ostreatus PC15]|uniref:SAP domain-containing protein n=1 Tax=Pleurotus ostreatus (strain PC15) TaxID=1137138 RepID=A0A067NSZ6_PLEO1|nr:hypothetical protein PLEOSDRAFT_154830 [Pleurotus ostreatus PC15]
MSSIMDLAALLSAVTLVTQLSDKNRIDELEAEIKCKVAELEARTSSLDASEAENNYLRAGGATKATKEESTSTQLAEAEISQASAEESMKQSVEIKYLKGKNNELVKQLKSMQQIRDDLETHCKELTTAVDSHAKELLEYDQKIEDVRKARDEAKMEITRLKKKLEKAETEVETQITQVRFFQACLNDRQSTITDYKSRLHTKVKEAESLAEDKALLTDQLQPVSHSSQCIDLDVGEVHDPGNSYVKVEADVIEADPSDDGRVSDTKLKRPARPRMSRPTAPLPKSSAPPPPDNDINLMTIPQLKQLLESMGAVPAKGNKPVLQAQALALAREERERLHSPSLNDGHQSSD